jgi:hypothetical protein
MVSSLFSLSSLAEINFIMSKTCHLEVEISNTEMI